MNETINETLNQSQQAAVGTYKELGTQYSQTLTDYFTHLPSLVMQGDIVAIFLALIGGFILLYLLNKMSGLLLYVLKRIIIFLITGIAGWFFFQEFMAKKAVEGLTVGNIIFGIIGIIICLGGIILALYTLIKQSRSKVKEDKGVLKKEADDTAMLNAATGGKTPVMDKVDFQDKSLIDQLKDKSFLTIMVYLVVAEFGVFSSKTISAPEIGTGIVFFGIFLVASFIFIKASYHSYWKGLRHLFVTFFIAGLLSVLLGIFWGGYTYAELFSMNYFKTDALVALITGVGVSLFAGSRK